MKSLNLGILLTMLLAVPSALAGTFGVTLSTYGEGGDACTGVYAAEESFGSGNLSGTSLSYSGSAIGLDNGWPNGGCASSPVFGHFSAFGSAEPGVLGAAAHADGSGNINFGFGDSTVGYEDTFTAVSGGVYDFTFHMYGGLEATPTCPGGVTTSMSFVSYFNGGNTFAEVGWNPTDCDPNAAVYTYGPTTEIDPETVVVSVSTFAGESFTISSTLHVHAGLGGYNATAESDYSDTSILDITGKSGATYSMASGVVYDAQEGTPEPSTWLVMIFALAGMAYYRRICDGRWGKHRARIISTL